MKSKTKTTMSIFLVLALIMSLFTGCNGDVDEKLFNGAGTEPIVKVTYTPQSPSRKLASEPVTVTVKVPSRVVLKSFLADNGIVAENVTGLEFYGIREIQGNNNDGTTFASCEKLETVYMDKSLTDIGDYSFYKGTALPLDVLLMEGVERIGKYAFNGCNQLGGVIFPETIKQIDEQAFFGCEGMETVVFTGKTAPSIASDAFNSEKIVDILVPAGCSESYKSVLPEALKTKVAEKEIYTITFDANGGTGTMFPETLIEGKTEKLTLCEFTPPEGKVFAGWNTAKDGSGTAYADEADITLTSDITLYAQWKDSAAALPYLCFTAVEDNSTVGMSVEGSWTKTVPSFEYSMDGNTWTDFVAGTTTVTLANKDDKFYIRNKESNNEFSEDNDNYLKFVMTGKIAAFGNVMSLLDKDCLMDTLYENALTKLFFECTALTTAPELPATTLNPSCYDNMFCECTSLTTAPALPAETLASNCYLHMFHGCRSLTEAPALPAMTLANECYSYMFANCVSLTGAPALPATTLASNCYDGMFSGCTALTTAPELPADTLAGWCYQNMFEKCTSLTTAPELPATTLENYCYQQMFKGCTSLNKIEVGFSAWDPSNATINWVEGVAATGEFTCPEGLPETKDASHIPSGWTVSHP